MEISPETCLRNYVHSHILEYRKLGYAMIQLYKLRFMFEPTVVLEPKYCVQRFSCALALCALFYPWVHTARMYLLLKQWVKIIHFQTTKANCANPRAVMFRERWGSAMDVCPLQVLTRLMWHKRDLEPPRQVGPHCSSCRAQKRWECMHAEACLVTGGQVSEVAFLLVCVFQDALSTMLIVTSRICIGMYLSHSV